MSVLLYKQENDEQTSSPTGSETAGPQRPRSNSGRELTDEVMFVRAYLHSCEPMLQDEHKNRVLQG